MNIFKKIVPLARFLTIRPKVETVIYKPALLGTCIGAIFGMKPAYARYSSDPYDALDIFVDHLSKGFLCGVLWPVTIPAFIWLWSSKK